MTKTIGVIGLGSIGMRHKTNLWKELKETEVVGYDPDPSKANGTGWIMGDLRAMIEMCDCIIIASPTYMHREHLHLCAGAAMPVFVEKPIADCITDAADEITYEGVTMVGYNLRFHSCVKAAKEWLDGGDIGQPIWANFTLGQYSAKPPYLRDGVIFNWSHEIDLALYLLGRGSVAGSSTRLSDGRDDVSDILMTHENGCHSVVHLDYVTNPEVRQGIIVGTKGQIIFDLVNRHAWLRGSDGDMIDSFEGHETWNDNYIEEMKAFLDRCDGKKTIGCTGAEGIEVLKICMQVRKEAGL
jgi:predicted dehydrogenase